jgi:hypothetical protein
MAVPQANKLWSVLSASRPENESFISNVVSEKQEKMTMCSATCFSFPDLDTGKNTWVDKPDMENAYKNVPCPPKETALPNFDMLGKTSVT